MAGPSPSEIFAAYVDALTTQFGATCSIRRGPIQALRLGTKSAAIVCELGEMVDGEQSRGSGNTWTHNWALNVTLLVPDDPDDPDAAEDARLALLDDWLDWQGELAQRCMVLAKVGRVTRCAPLLVTVVADTEQVYRAVECTVTYMALRSG